MTMVIEGERGCAPKAVLPAFAPAAPVVDDVNRGPTGPSSWRRRCTRRCKQSRDLLHHNDISAMGRGPPEGLNRHTEEHDTVHIRVSQSKATPSPATTRGAPPRGRAHARRLCFDANSLRIVCPTFVALEMIPLSYSPAFLVACVSGGSRSAMAGWPTRRLNSERTRKRCPAEATNTTLVAAKLNHGLTAHLAPSDGRFMQATLN